MLLVEDPTAVDGTLWLGWFVAILLLILIPVIHYLDHLKYLKIIYCYEEREKNGKRVISNSVSWFGEFKKSKFDESRKMFKLTFKKNLRKRIVYSEFSMEEYLASFLHHRYLTFFYELDTYVFKRELPKERTVQLEYTTAWKVYLLFKAIFQFKFRSIFTSFLFMGLIVSGCCAWDFIAFLLGGLLGVGIGIINTFLYNAGVIKPKKKEETQKSELIMFPTEPKYKIIDVYKVKGEENVTIMKADKPQKEWQPFLKIIEGFEELQKMVLSDLYRNIEYVKIEERQELRSPNEMKQTKHNALYQMRYLYNQLLNGKENNMRLQKDNRNLYNQLAYFKETSDQERKQFAVDILLQQQKNGKSFQEIIKQLSGDLQLGVKYDKIVSRAIKEIELQRNDKRYEKLELLYTLQVKVLEKLTQLKNGDTVIDIAHLIEKLNLKEDDFIGIGGNTKKEKEGT